MRKMLYLGLMNHLLELKDESGESVVRHIDLWNEQVEFIEQETPFDTPAVFIELRPTSWTTLGGGVQQSNQGIRLHIVTAWHGSATAGSVFLEESLQRFDLLDRIDAHLAGYSAVSGRCSVSMMQRTGSTTNHNHEELVEDVSDFTCLLTDGGPEE